MNTFRVWAPRPRKVEVQAGNKVLPMSAGADGWWTAETPAEPGGDYGFILDGAGPFPDPRSPWQPHGVHALSRLVDHGTFRWSDAGWQPPLLSAAVIYELHVGTFTPAGTFAAAIERLAHLAALGVTHVELMPVNEFPGDRGWGYDGVALFAPHHVYGGPRGLKELVDACHARGLAVLLDVVYNHLGPSGNYLDCFGPYLTTRYAALWGPTFNLDGPDSDQVRRFLCDNARMWLRDYHLDGLRLDAVHAMVDTSAEPLLEQFGVEVRKLQAELGRRLVLIAESDANDPRLLWPRERGGFGLDAQWNDDFHHALHAVLTGERNGYFADFGTLAQLGKALRQAYVLDGCYSVHRRRRHGRPPAGLCGRRFLAYLQNHDQIGNRAQGERSRKLMSLGRLKAGAALVFTSPFVPMLFQGEEWGAATPFLYFTDHREPKLAQAVREGRQREFAAFGWRPEEIPDPEARETFELSKLNWSEIPQSPHLDLLAWHRQLIRLRRVEPALTDGRLDLVRAQWDEQGCWLTVERGVITTACNFAAAPQRVRLRAGKQRALMISETGIVAGDGFVELPPDSAAIVKLDENSRRP